MKLTIGWVECGVPFVAAVMASARLVFRWRSEQHRFVKTLAVVLAILTALWACGALAYVQFVRPLAPFDYTVECWGLLLSLSAAITGGIAVRYPPRDSARLAFGASAWMFVMFFLSSLTL